jgi:hypothetical protein
MQAAEADQAASPAGRNRGLGVPHPGDLYLAARAEIRGVGRQDAKDLRSPRIGFNQPGQLHFRINLLIASNSFFVNASPV